jgi:hypothetical protein
VLSDRFAEAQPLIQLANKNQAAAGGDPRSLEIDLQRSVERELEWSILFLTYWVFTSGASSSR